MAMVLTMVSIPIHVVSLGRLDNADAVYSVPHFGIWDQVVLGLFPYAPCSGHMTRNNESMRLQRDRLSTIVISVRTLLSPVCNAKPSQS